MQGGKFEERINRKRPWSRGWKHLLNADVQTNCMLWSRNSLIQGQPKGTVHWADPGDMGSVAPSVPIYSVTSGKSFHSY